MDNYKVEDWVLITISSEIGGEYMINTHNKNWPSKLPTSLEIPETTLCHNLEVSASRYPNKVSIIYYGAEITYLRLYEEVNAMAAYLQNLGVKKQDKVLLYMQNCPQFIVAYYAILKIGSVVVPVNPMNVTEELKHYIQDGSVKVAFASQELHQYIEPLISKSCLEHIILVTYSDYAGEYKNTPNVVKMPRITSNLPSVINWNSALNQLIDQKFPDVSPDDLAVMPYTSGTTGKPKGCMHVHRSIQANTRSWALWCPLTTEANVLSSLPLFHVAGMVHSMLVPIYVGATMVLLTRWNRETAAEMIEKYRCSHWTTISTMVIDFLANPNLPDFDISSLKVIEGGGATLPDAVCDRLLDFTGINFVEVYGLTETMAHTHCNLMDIPKRQCMGIPAFDVDARIIDPQTLIEKGPGVEGEIILNGPQLFKGYWNRPEENEKAFVTIDGKRYFRTGDIGYYDNEGFFFMIDRLKRIINASGFKVSPTEIESILFKHPAIQQVCVIGVPDNRKGEEIKAFIVLKEDQRRFVSPEDIINWTKKEVAAYKYPRIIEFVEELPVSASGKILWRQLQEAEWKKISKLL